MNTLKTISQLFSLIALLGASACQRTPDGPAAGSPSLFSNWEQGAVSEITITTDLQQLLANRREEIYQPARLQWSGAPSFGVELRPRGITRRQYCDFPPLKVNFKKDDLREAGFYPEFDKLKLVTQCTADENLVLREYLAYQLYGELTDHSFRTRLVRVRYVDEQDRLPAREQYAVVLEPDEEMAHRLGGELLPGNHRLRAINATHYQLLAVYQYMIGNTDWNLDKGHNIALVRPPDGGAPVPVPYDFDYAGLTDAPYAKPHPQLPLDNVRQRFFQFRGKNADGLPATLQQFRDRKSDLINRVETLDGLTAPDKQEVRDYLESFFLIIANQDLLESELFVNLSERLRNIS